MKNNIITMPYLEKTKSKCVGINASKYAHIMNPLKHIVCLLALLIAVTALSGCTSRATAMNRLSVGMTKQQVISILGKPSSTAAPGNGVELLRYTFKDGSWARATMVDNEYFVLLRNGTVEQYGRVGDFDSTKDPTLNLNVNKNP